LGSYLEFVWILDSFYGCDLKKVNFKKVWLVGLRYVFGKNCGWSLCVTKNMYKCFVKLWLRLLFKVFFTWKYIKIIYFLFFKIIFYISASKWYKNIKNISIWSKEQNKKFQFFSKAFLKSKNKQGFTKLS
jgi:hypothetical protein